ncbi:diguanylate cyclase domain-containing protein [Pseudidiomarina sp.]|uniref:diguanylate cyclase domain-containing protein n=1 Tax=Pseudidiomarina sp. TaxID=2081707 RepID=UPI003A969A25
MFTTKARRIAFIIAVLSSLLLALTAIEYFHVLNKERVRAQKLSELQSQFTALRADIESELNAAIYGAWGVASYLTAHPGSDVNDWLVPAQTVVNDNPIIRNLAIAPNNVISFVYPLTGNEMIIGYNYEQIPDQRDVVRRAQETHKAILAGPVNLLQGGEGVIYRIPIFSHENGIDEYWGIVAVVIEMDKLFHAVGIDALMDKYAIALQGRDGKGADGDVFWGTPDVFANADFKERVRFPNGHWLIALATEANQNGGFWEQQRVRLIGYPYVVALYIMLFTLFVWYRTSYGEAMLDPLTNVSNRRMVMERLQTLVHLYDRHPTPFAVVVIDIDRFKRINDDFGHQAGDLVLKSLAQRMLTHTRATDTVARIGGDEFLVVLMGIDNEKVVAEQCEKLAEVIAAPIRYKSEDINVSASLGYALFPANGKTLDALIHSADSKMYKSKRKS